MLVIGLAALLSAQPVSAQSVPPSSSGTEAATAQPEKPVEEQEERKKAWGFRWDDHPSVFFGKNTHIDLRARMQAHVRESDAPIGDPSAFDVARRRIGIDGRIASAIDFQIEREIGDDEPWRDVYLDYRRYESVRVQAGKFKLPFSLDENTSATNLDFVYRSRAATQLAPGRDRGVMIHGRTLDRLLRYELGMFVHDGRNARTRNPEHVFGNETIAGRVTAQPFRASNSPIRDLQVGAAFTSSEVPEGIAALRGRTALDASFFPADFWVQGRRQRVGLEARWRPGPFSITGEYIRVTTERRGQSVEDTDLSPLIANGWYLSGTCLVTGEKKSAGADRPRRRLLRGGLGALELAVRFEDLTFRSGASDDVPSWGPRADVVQPNSDRASTFGVNWFPLRGVKVQANWVHELISDPSHGPFPSRPGFWSKVLRVQFSL